MHEAHHLSFVLVLLFPLLPLCVCSSSVPTNCNAWCPNIHKFNTYIILTIFKNFEKWWWDVILGYQHTCTPTAVITSLYSSYIVAGWKVCLQKPLLSMCDASFAWSKFLPNMPFWWMGIPMASQSPTKPLRWMATPGISCVVSGMWNLTFGFTVFRTCALLVCKSGFNDSVDVSTNLSCCKVLLVVLSILKQ